MSDSKAKGKDKFLSVSINRIRILKSACFGQVLLLAFISCFLSDQKMLEAQAGESSKAKSTKALNKPSQSKAKASQKGDKSKAAEAMIEKGKRLYKANDCAACHKIGKEGCADGVPLDGIGKKRSEKFLTEHLQDPDAHVSKNKAAFGGDPVNLMPALDLDKSEIKLIVQYLKSLQ